MKLECWICGHEFDGSISYDPLGWHSYCEECDTSFDVDIPQGRIVMALCDPDWLAEHYEDDFIDDMQENAICAYYAFNDFDAFIAKWNEIFEWAEGYWYWIIVDGHPEPFLSGVFEMGDMDIFEEYAKNHNESGVLL